MFGRRLRIAVGVCVHNEEDFIEYALRGIYDFADVIGVCVNVGTPWGGRAEPLDHTLELVRGFPDPARKLRIMPGQWANEIDQRNANLDLVRDKADYFMVVDADEFYTGEHLDAIRRFVSLRPWVGQLRIRVDTYWKTNPVHKIDPPEPLKQYIVSRIRPSTRFTGLRMTNQRWRCVIPRRTAVLHHFSYARPTEKIAQKLRNFSHRDRIVLGWMGDVWLPWDSDRTMENLHPTNPPEYKRAILVAPSQLPEVVREHPYVREHGVARVPVVRPPD